MKRIGLGIVALGLSLSALTLGGKAANAAEPCGSPVVVQPSGYGYYGNQRARDFGIRERIRLEREREQARRRWSYNHRY